MHGMIPTVLSVLIAFTGILMMFFILLQDSKGGALTILDGTKATNLDTVNNPLRRATAVLAGLFFVLVIVRTMIGG